MDSRRLHHELSILPGHLRESANSGTIRVGFRDANLESYCICDRLRDALANSLFPAVPGLNPFVFLQVAASGSDRIHADTIDVLGFPYVFIAHIGTMFVSLGLLVFYIVHVFKNAALAEDRRILWTLIIFMGSFVAMPVYWVLYVWPQSGASQASA
jgi:hypothetical protein